MNLQTIFLILSALFFISCSTNMQASKKDKNTHSARAEKAFSRLDSDTGTSAASRQLEQVEKKSRIKSKQAESPVDQAEQEIRSDRTKNGYSLKDGFPLWFYYPDLDNNFGAVGIAENVGIYSDRKNLAVKIAHAELSRMIKLAVNTEIISEQTLTKNSSGHEFLSKLKSHSDRKSTRLNSSHTDISRMPSSS